MGQLTTHHRRVLGYDYTSTSFGHCCWENNPPVSSKNVDIEPFVPNETTCSEEVITHHEPS